MAASGTLLEGKKVLVTGASKGLGRELACAFAREGAFLVLCSDPGSKSELEQVRKARTRQSHY